MKLLNCYRSTALAGVVLAAAPMVPSAAGQPFLDVTSLSPGPNHWIDSFNGTLGGVGVSGSIANHPSIKLSSIGNGHGDSTTNQTSAQWHDSTIYTPSIAVWDRVGYSKATAGATRLTISFATPITNPVFHVAHLDTSTLDFSPTTPVSGPLVMNLLSGNAGPDNDGLDLISNTLRDLNPATALAWSTSTPPPTFNDGARSAYGSVELVGTYSTLLIDARNANSATDIGSFMISTVPEPAMVSLGLVAGVGLIARHRRQLAGSKRIVLGLISH